MLLALLVLVPPGLAPEPIQEPGQGAGGPAPSPRAASLEGDGFGFGILPAGDLDGDGACDLLIGESYDPDVPDAIHVVSSRTGALVTTLRAKTEDESWLPLGALGDVDENGAIEIGVLVTPTEVGIGATGPGEVRVLSSADGSVVRSWPPTDEDEDARADFRARLVADQDEDGVRELVVSELGPHEHAPEVTAIATLSGRSFEPLRRIELDGPRTTRWWFEAGDLDADGVPEIGIYEDVEWMGQWDVRMLSGADGSPLETWKSELGWSWSFATSRAGDIDGDGADDLFVARRRKDRRYLLPKLPGDRQLLVRIVSGRTGSILTGRSTSLEMPYGARTVLVGDVDGDGLPDVLVLADRFVGLMAEPGVALLLSGRDLSTIATIEQASKPFVHEHFGSSGCAPGDVNDDGVPDVAIAACGAPWSWVVKGAVEIRSGKDGSALRVITLASLE